MKYLTALLVLGLAGIAVAETTIKAKLDPETGAKLVTITKTVDGNGRDQRAGTFTYEVIAASEAAKIDAEIANYQNTIAYLSAIRDKLIAERDAIVSEAEKLEPEAQPE